VTAPEEFPLSLRNVLKSFGLSRHTVLKLIELGFVAPVKADDNVWKFSFQDLVLLRSANELRAARIPTRQILKALRQLRASLPEDQPLQGMRITSEGDRVTVRFGDAHWEPQTGQFVLDLQIRSGESPLRFFPSRSAPLVDAVALDARFAEAEAAEETAPRIAEALYRSILADDPTYAHAYLNLGFGGQVLAQVADRRRAGDQQDVGRAAFQQPGQRHLHRRRAQARATPERRPTAAA
jgi:DNA-binding transcriptional MerR regulator